MDDDLDLLRRGRMRWNTPLSPSHAELLLDRLDLREGLSVTDLGCGWGEFLLRAAARTGRGTGVDTDPAGLARGRALAAERGLADRVEFVHADASTWAEPTDRVVCVGASHAFGGTRAAVEALAPLVSGGGRVLFGDGFWQRTPGQAAVDIFGTETRTLADLADTVRAAGWRILHLSTADEHEWDEFESTSLLALEEWLLDHGADPRAAEIRDWLDTRRHQYLHDYRGVLGFAHLVLAR
ncbi:cyclopropane-fatty-acyl-phospholipid synthase family protein [Amycolatopsis sp. 195334CR]|uniref:SAM-dependent methyltransferase n=1 Tax=Amycolatopsis sp. 195334CR TaxID=2814588 RepID=UPI001A8EC959|nr:methyltransferase domain-containing protein [Amycolatopsis sp. 195334CR]MBN6042244.1 methyltransferase domain-containing protein [Amycolatopsis sp. 195334CR]